MALGATRSARMSSGLLLDPLPSPTAEPAPGGTRFRPYASADHHVTKARYITSNDPRGYIPVYEYPLNGQWIMLDMDDGYVLWTGIWKALGNSKADIVKIIDSQPDLAAQLRRVRGGYLKIQGTWMPYEIALRLARRVAWPIRYDLVPLFGPTFPDTCLHPDSPGYGQIAKPGTGKRRTRRHAPPAELPHDSRHDWAVFSPAAGDAGGPPSTMGPPLAMSHTFAAHAAGRRYDGAADNGHGDSPVILHVPYVERPHVSQTATVAAPNGFARGNSPPYESAAGVRYSPYPSPLSATTSRYAHPSRGMGMGSADISPTTSRPHTGRAQASGLPIGETIQLPPIRPPAGRNGVDNGSFHLPPISSMDNLREAQCGEPMAVLRRLQSTDEPPELTSGSSSGSRGRSTPESLAQRRHSLADPVYKSSEPSSISPGVGVGAQSTGGLRTPLSAVAALPSPSPYLPLPTPRHPQSHHQPRSEADHPETAFLSGSRPRGGRGGSGSARDDRPCLSTQSMPPSPSTSAYLDARGGVAYRLRPEEARHPPLPQERVFSRQERPLSPPPSATSADDSPVDSVRSSWRPW